MWRQDLIFPYPKPVILFRLMRWGVCVGAPLVVVVARSWPLRTILLALVGLFVAGNLLMALSADYWMGLCARFVSGLPHGAYFGVGSIVASRLAEKGKSTSAVAIMIMGMTIANLFGVPAGNFLGHFLSWRLVFVIAALWGGVTIWFIRRWFLFLPALPATNLKGQFSFFEKAGTVDADCCYHVRKRGSFLLV